jgi:hypothetical protein
MANTVCETLGHDWYKGQATWVCKRLGCNAAISATNGIKGGSSMEGSFQLAADVFFVDVTKPIPHQPVMVNDLPEFVLARQNSIADPILGGFVDGYAHKRSISTGYCIDCGSPEYDYHVSLPHDWPIYASIIQGDLWRPRPWGESTYE